MHEFELETTLDDRQSAFDKDYCPNVIVVYWAKYNADYDLARTEIKSVWEVPVTIKDGTEYVEVPLEELSTKDLKWLISKVTQDAEERYDEAKVRDEETHEFRNEDAI